MKIIVLISNSLKISYFEGVYGKLWPTKIFSLLEHLPNLIIMGFPCGSVG